MKEVFRIYIVCMMTIFGTYSLNAQEVLKTPKSDEVSIGNVKVSREGKELVVDYQIILGDDVISCKVDVEMLVGANGKKYTLKPSELKGDTGKITSTGFRQVRYDVEKRKTLLAGKDIRFTLKVSHKDALKGNYLAVASLGVVPQLSYGLMLGYVQKYGGYAKFRSDFKFPNSSYTCSSNGEIEGGGFIWTNGEQRKSFMQITGGGLFRVAKWFYPYVGAGYGSRRVLWQDFKGEWAKVSDFSCASVAFEAGAIFKFGPVALSTGVSTIGFRYTDWEIGVGVMF